jgi:DNA-binding MarR family transcriptional regulator
MINFKHQKRIAMLHDDRLIFLLSKAQHKLATYLKKTLAEQQVKITGVQTGILFLLKRKACTMTELSKELSIDNSAITGMVDRLERSGFATREFNPSDRRTYLISITPLGLEEIEKAKDVVHAVNDKIKNGFTEEEIEVFKKVLNSFFTKFDNASILNCDRL